MASTPCKGYVITNGFETHVRRKLKNERKAMICASEKAPKKDPHKPWNRHNGLYSTIDKIEGSLKKLTRALTKTKFYFKISKKFYKG